MISKKAVLTLALLAMASARAAEFNGAEALAFTKRLVAFGPRPSGSDAIRKTQAYILGELKSLSCNVIQDDFTGSTPLGPTPMKNIIARFPGKSGNIVVITGHYDTKSMPGTFFVGANDGGSSAGFLMEMAKAIAHDTRQDEVQLVWFDGEEAVAQWTESDSLYGSRHLAERWAADGTLARITALINVDMIGDKDLDILNDLNSSAPLRELVWRVADQLGYGQHFLRQPGAIEDDHIPFLRRGVSALDLIDFTYGPNNSFWHNDKDTVDKLSAESLQIVGRVLIETLKELERDAGADGRDHRRR
ncbi:MAG TPA: M28 family peptidase [Bryobacteraceae bacterium]|nr:M28 family peptidase [Bryobacteraceae bacterium]